MLTIAASIAFVPSAHGSSTKPTVHIGINHATITLGHSAVVAGYVTPNLHGHYVYLQKHSGTKWTSIARQKLSKKSWYSFTVKPTRTGTKTLRVYDPPTTTGRPKSASKSVTLKVRPRPTQNCTPGYSPCIPPGPDVDCAGGSGDGPRYVEGPVYVTGSDPYDLDRDGDGVGCES